MIQRTIRPDFVTFVPDSLEDGVLYISVPYATATHKCPCGCGESVVTPIRPADWSLTWDGESVTLRPSVGNWSLPCRSHYWIIENRVVWAGRLSPSEIEEGRSEAKHAREDYYRAKAGRAVRKGRGPRPRS
jgi:hypothetical protein